MPPGEVVAVLGTKGAPGATTVSIRLATELALRGQNTALVDLDPAGGDVMAYLGLDPKRNLFTLAHLVAGRVPNGEEVRAEGHRLGTDLFVLTGLPRREMATDVPPGFVYEVVQTLAGSSALVVCDVGRDASAPMVRPLIDRASSVIVVARADLVGIWNAERALAALPVEARERSQLVVSRIRRGETPTEVSSALGLPLAAAVPFVPAEARRAVAEQRPIRGRRLRSIGTLAGTFARGDPDPAVGGEPVPAGVLT
jgi:MinD-like ATPase involved in chromosome partitioning or flagellar assembly